MASDRLLNEAPRYGYFKIVKTLLNAGVGPSATTHHRQTSLHYAATAKHENVFDLLKEAGIDESKVHYLGMNASGYVSATTKFTLRTSVYFRS